jgi:hypothetical protein
MKYYKVKEGREYWDMKTGIHIGFTVENELLTEAEMKKMGFPFTSNFEPVEIKRNKTYKAFGCRFESKDMIL